jgi:hypothetical protein
VIRSEAATTIAHQLFTSGRVTANRLVLEFSEDQQKFRGHAGWSELAIADRIDDELQEVRAVLSLTADRRIPEHGHCWCRKDLTSDAEPHNEFCQRARALLTRLTVPETQEGK